MTTSLKSELLVENPGFRCQLIHSAARMIACNNQPLTPLHFTLSIDFALYIRPSAFSTPIFLSSTSNIQHTRPPPALNPSKSIMAQPDIIDLSSDNYDTTSFSYNIESVRTPRRISDDVIDQFANDHLSKHTKMHYKDFKKQNKLRQKQLINGSRKPVPIKNEDMNDQDQHMNGMKELYGEENGGYHGNSASHMSSSYFDPTPRPASSRRSKFPNYIMDNQRTPTRPGFGTPQRQGSDEDSLFIPESGEFSFDNTPSRKRRRTDHGSQQRIPPTAPMTPGSSSRNSSYHQPGLFRQQALSQKRGAGAKSFSPGGNAFITQEDLQTMVGELQGMIEKYTIGCANVATVYKELQVLKKKVQREQKENEDHMNKTMAEFFESNKKAIKDVCFSTNPRFLHHSPCFSRRLSLRIAC